jgi:hypothetical protein
MTLPEAVELLEEKISKHWDERALDACQEAAASGEIPADKLTDALWAMLQQSEAAKIAWLKQARPHIERIVAEADAHFKALQSSDSQ